MSHEEKKWKITKESKPKYYLRNIIKLNNNIFIVNLKLNPKEKKFKYQLNIKAFT